jgi:hypothetical protein
MFYIFAHVVGNIMALIYDTTLKWQIFSGNLFWPSIYYLSIILASYFYSIASHRPGYVAFHKSNDYTMIRDCNEYKLMKESNSGWLFALESHVPEDLDLGLDMDGDQLYTTDSSAIEMIEVKDEEKKEYFF